MHARTAASPQARGIAGYDFGKVARSPITLEELKQLEASTGFTEEDRRALARAGAILSDQAEALVDAWRQSIGSHQFLARWFFGPDGKPDERYKAAVKARFVRWVVDLCTRPFDQAWLDYQHEIGLRHTPEKKNRTDGAQSAPFVPLRYLLAFTAPVVLAARARLEAAGAPPEEVNRMHAAWTKAVILSVTLWSRAYAPEGQW
jgi:hypothetical protein